MLMLKTLIEVKGRVVCEVLLESLVCDQDTDEHADLGEWIIFITIVVVVAVAAVVVVRGLKMGWLLLFSLLVALNLGWTPVDVTLSVPHVTADNDRVLCLYALRLELLILFHTFSVDLLT